jgi:nucleoid-associated protein YgaU
MDKERTPFQATQPDSGDDCEYETAPPRGRILWGRILALAVALVLAFLVGRTTAGHGGSISAARYRQVKEDLAAARAKIATQNPAPSATTATPVTSPSSQPSESATAGGGNSYTVKSGDTLRGIAIKFYGDASLADLIAQANNISDPALVHQGTKLLIPPKP